MKKSNVILISASILAISWTVLIGWLGASTIKNYLHGKELVFAHSHTQFLESKKKTFPVPSLELNITADETTLLTIIPGNTLSVLAHPRLWNCVYTDLKNGKSRISLTRITEYPDPVTITMPDIPSLSLDNFSSVTLRGLKGKELLVKCNKVLSLNSEDCRIQSLNLDFPGIKDQQEIILAKSNQIDTLIASVSGFGNIRLETAGKLNNQISLAESIKLEAGSEIVNKLSVAKQFQRLNK
jgi:hypothetical protein